MASALDTRRKVWAELLPGIPFTQADIDAVGGEDALLRNYGPDNEQAQRNEIMGSDTYKNLQRKNAEDKLRGQAQSRYGPEYQAAQTGFNLANSQFDLSGARLDQNKIDIGRQYDRNAETLKEQADAARRGMEERNNQLGLLSSGLTAAGGGKIASDLNRSLGESEQDKTSKLADLALQRAGLEINRAGNEAQRGLSTSTYNRNVQDYIDKALEGDPNSNDKTFNNQLAIAKLFENPFSLSQIPDDVLTQLLQSAGFTVTQ